VTKEGTVQAAAKVDINPYTSFDLSGAPAVAIAVVFALTAVALTVAFAAVLIVVVMKDNISSMMFGCCGFVLGAVLVAVFAFVSCWWFWDQLSKLSARVDNLKQEIDNLKQEKCALSLMQNAESRLHSQFASASLAIMDKHYVSALIVDPDTQFYLALEHAQDKNGGQPEFTNQIVGERTHWMIVPHASTGIKNNGVGAVMLAQKKGHTCIYSELKAEVCMYEVNWKSSEEQGWWVKWSEGKVAFQHTKHKRYLSADGAKPVIQKEPKWFEFRVIQQES